MEAFLEHAISTQGFTVVAFLAAIIALWRSLTDAHTSRIAALEKAVDECMDKHAKCEKHNRELSRALVDLIERRGDSALVRCRALLSESSAE